MASAASDRIVTEEGLAQGEALIADKVPTTEEGQSKMTAPHRQVAAETMRLHASDWSAFLV
jgi:hypothetical protein